MNEVPVTELKGIGEKTFSDLQLMDITTIQDLLMYFPYRYDVHEIKPLRELLHEDKVTIEGSVLYEPSLNFYGRNRSRLTFTVEVEMVAVRVVMFNRGFLKSKIKPGSIVTLTGKWDAHRLQITANYLKQGEANSDSEITAFYSLKGELKPARFRTFISNAITDYGHTLEDPLPPHILEDYRLPKLKDALQAMHFPQGKTDLKHARRRFTYEEFLHFQLRMQMLRKIQREQSKGHETHYNQNQLAIFMKTLPYELTGAQKRSLNEILTDLSSTYRMNRLLQGDVGSGKTAVAALALYGTVTGGKQGAFMVPTEILAEQHYKSLVAMLPEGVSVGLLTSSIKGKARKELLKQLESGEINILIGTHALIQDDVFFERLGLAIIDEQHRFGVKQRRVLREKGLNTDVLFMTATPIPRTLAITAFGDMDVSLLDEMPAGRKIIETYWTQESALDRVLNFIEKHVEQGEQAYIVCPLIEESDKLEIQNTVDLYNQLKIYYGQRLNVDLLHGRMSSNEKEEVMNGFKQNETQVLISTTVIEVGVDVPNATIMVVYDAERFGLSQLHQLRGRVGRGKQQSFCILIADPKTDIGRERMKIMTETNDGFELSEADLKLRGPGDFFGAKQSGLPEFKVADMIHDYRALETARQDAVEMIASEKLFTDPAYKQLYRVLQKERGLTEKMD